MNHAFKLVPEDFADQEEQPMAQEPPPAYMPEALPGLEALEQIGTQIAEQARYMKMSGQMIVHDLRGRRGNIDKRAAALQRGCLADIERIERDFIAKMEENRREAAEVDAMIASYVNEPVQVQQPEPQELMPRQPKPKLLALFGRR